METIKALFWMIASFFFAKPPVELKLPELEERPIASKDISEEELEKSE